MWWLKSVFLKTVHDYRIAILGWGIGMGLVVASPMASVATLVSTPQAREQLDSLAASFAWNADVVAVNTIGGYATWMIGMFIFLIAISPLLAGDRMLPRVLERGPLHLLTPAPPPPVGVARPRGPALWRPPLASARPGRRSRWPDIRQDHPAADSGRLS